MINKEKLSFFLTRITTLDHEYGLQILNGHVILDQVI